MSKKQLYEVDVEQKSIVVDKLVMAVRADDKGEAIKLVQMGLGDFVCREELEREPDDLYIDTAVVTEVEEVDDE